MEIGIVLDHVCSLLIRKCGRLQPEHMDRENKVVSCKMSWPVKMGKWQVMTVVLGPIK